MIKMIALIAKRPELSFDEFRSYYEDHHVPLISGLITFAEGYRRNYIDKSTILASGDNPELSFDVITELWFKDRSAYEAQEDVMRSRDVRRQVAADEARFMQRDKTKMFLVTEVGSPSSVALSSPGAQ